MYKFTYDDAASPGDNPEMNAYLESHGYSFSKLDGVFKCNKVSSKEELRKSLEKSMSDKLIDKIFDTFGWRLYEDQYGLFIFCTEDSYDFRDYNYRSTVLEGKKDGQYIVSVDVSYENSDKKGKEYYALSYDGENYILADKFDSLPPAVNSFLTGEN